MITSKPFYASLLMLTLSLIMVYVIAMRPKPSVVQTNLEKLPMTILGYTATEDFFSDAVYRELNADKHVFRHYKAQSGESVDLYIGYYGTAKGGRTPHNPYACLPGSGAAIVATEVVNLKQSATGKNIPVNYILSRKDGASTVMLHWYQTAGTKVVSTGLKQNIERFKGRVFHNRNDGAFVRVSAYSEVDNIEKTRQRAELFAENILNLLPDYWPLER